MTQIGLMLEGQAGLTWERWQRLLRAAEDLGYEFMFRSDHFTIGPPDEESLETWVSLTYAASHTTRIEFGPMVSPVTFRHPSLLARMAAAVDDLSGGRLVFGLGAGWHEREHRQFGIPFYDKKTRLEMLEEALEVTTRLLNSDEPVSYQGQHFSLDGAILLPRPQRPGGPPILIGGNGPKVTLPLAARYADEWNGVGITPDDYRWRNQRLTELLEQQGRDPSSVKRSLMTKVTLGADDRPAERITGSTSEIVDKIGQYVDAGVQRFMLQWLELDNMDGIETLARDVLPHFHK